jgi:sterol desaturase/sphingolipid hydroxylase (fatty acid hydroxylase superfamily)
VEGSLEHPVSNLWPTLCLWDHCFGTFLQPKSHPVKSLGIECDPAPAGFFYQLPQPFVDNYRVLRRTTESES